jgi:hypothetical protein
VEWQGLFADMDDDDDDYGQLGAAFPAELGMQAYY